MGVRLTEPVFGMRRGSFSEVVEAVEFHRRQFNGGSRVEDIPFGASSDL